MAQLLGKNKKFKAKGKDGMADMSVVPNGYYLMAITESSREKTKDGKNYYTKLRVDILRGEYKGRCVFRNLNLEHSNEQAQEIAERELISICNACGLAAVEDSEELHGIPMLCKVGIKKGNDEYGDQNIIRKYSQPSEDELESYAEESEDEDDDYKKGKKGKKGKKDKKDKKREKDKKKKGKKNKKASWDD